MDIQDKTKQELLKELQELQRADNALKVSAEVDMIVQKQTMEALQASEERFQLLFNKAPLGYQSLDFDGNFIEVNQQWLDTLGYEREEVIGKWFGDFLTLAYQDGFRKRFPIFKEQGKIHSEFEMIHKNGSYLFIAFEGRIGYDVNGSFKQTHCILQDITSIKQTEKDLIKNRELLKSMEKAAKIGGWEFDVETMVQTWTEEIFHILEIDTTHGAPDVPEGIGFIAPEYQPMALLGIQRAIEFGEPYNQEWEVITTKGNKRWVNAIAKPYQENGKTKSVSGSFQDITKRKLSEIALLESEKNLLRTNEEYRRSNQLLDESQSISKVGGWEFDIVNNKLYWTAETYRIHDTSPQEFNPTVDAGVSYFLPESKIIISEALELAITQGKGYDLLLETYTTKGRKIYVRTTCQVTLVDGKPIKLTGIFQDITEQKQEEQKLKALEQQSHAWLENSPTCTKIVDLDFNLQFMSSAGIKGLKIDDITPYYGKPYPFHFYPESFKTKMTGNMNKAIETGEVITQEAPFVDIIGNEVWYHSTIVPAKDDNGRIEYLIIVSMDTTERKYAEEKLRESEAIKNTMVSNIGDVIVIIDQNGITQYKSPNITKLFGWKPEELIGKNTWDNVHPDDLEAGQKFFGTILTEPNATGTKEIRYKRKDGNYVWIEINVINLLHDKDIQGVLGNYHDISDRKQAENELIEAKKHAEESEEKYRLLYDSNQMPISIFEADTLKFLSVNNAFVQKYGYTKEEFLTMTILDIRPESEIEKVKQLVNVIDKGLADVGIYLHRKKNGDIIQVEIIRCDIVFEGKKAKLVFAHDVTDKLKAEQELSQAYNELKLAKEKAEESEAFFRSIFENSPVGKSITGLDGSLKTNKAFSDMLGYSFEEFQTKNFDAITNPDDIQKSKEAVEALLKGEAQVYRFEKKYIHKNGSVVYADVVTTLQKNRDGKPLFFITSVNDITERKQSEKALKESEERFKNMFEKHSSIMLLVEPESGMITGANNASATYYGYSKPELLSMRIDQINILPPDEIKVEREQALREERNYFIFPHRLANGEVRTVEVHSSPIIFQNQKILFSIIQDITERKHLEKIREIQYNIATAVVASDNVEQLLELVRIELSQLFDTTNFFAALYNAQNNTLKKLHWVDEVDNYEEWDAAKSFSGYVVQTGKTLLINKQEITKLAAEQNIPITGTPAECWLGVPLLVDKKPIGVLVIQSYIDPKAYDASGAMLFEQIAYDLGVYIEKTRILQNLNVAKLQAEVNEQRLSAFMNAIPDIICYKDGEGKWLLANDADLELFCLKGVEYFGKTDRELAQYTNELYADAFRACMETDEKSWNKRSISKGIEVIPTVSGGKKVFEVYKIPSFYQNGERKGLAVIGRDITELFETEQNLLLAKEKAEESEEKFKLIFDKSLVAILIANDKGDFLSANNAAADLLGFPIEELLKMNVGDLKTTIKPDAHDRYHKYLELGEEKGEFDFFTKSEERKIAYYHAVRIKSDFNLSMLINITNQKKTEQDLLIAKLHAEESDRLKSAFLANMSHEIRTPMNGILGFAELLKEPDLTGEQQQEYIKIIEKSGARMLNIINDIVDISKIESGLMKLAINETNVNEQIEYIYTFFKPEVESKGIRLAFRNALPAKEAILKTDREKVYAILTNLVKNAIKYTDKGSIEFGYSVVVDTGHALSIPQKSFLQFYVKDTGIGIPKDRQDAIFERFIQADMADVQARQGAGLGLAISKSYVELLGGKIWVEGEMGLGSTFYFSLPFNAETVIETINQQFAPSAITEPIRKLKILIAEDDEVSEMLIDITAKTLGKEILKVRSGVQAVEACRDNPDIDLILMDIRMPEMGGYEATKKIREFNKDVVIIAQTAYGLSGDREKAIEAGCNDYISKPINKEILLSIIHKNFNE
jgi:PAS domain S-box-containing protein